MSLSRLTSLHDFRLIGYQLASLDSQRSSLVKLTHLELHRGNEIEAPNWTDENIQALCTALKFLCVLQGLLFCPHLSDSQAVMMLQAKSSLPELSAVT